MENEESLHVDTQMDWQCLSRSVRIGSQVHHHPLAIETDVKSVLCPGCVAIKNEVVRLNDTAKFKVCRDLSRQASGVEGSGFEW